MKTIDYKKDKPHRTQRSRSTDERHKRSARIRSQSRMAVCDNCSIPYPSIHPSIHPSIATKCTAVSTLFATCSQVPLRHHDRRCKQGGEHLPQQARAISFISCFAEQATQRDQNPLQRSHSDHLPRATQDRRRDHSYKDLMRHTLCTKNGSGYDRAFPECVVTCFPLGKHSCTE